MLDLHLLAGDYVICRLPAGSPLPPGLPGDGTRVVSVTWAPGETSLFCPSDLAPEGAEVDTVWRCFRAGPVDLTQTGALDSLASPLADARVNIFAFSTHDSDYLCVPAVRLGEAMGVLSQAGHRISEEPPAASVA